MTADDFVALLRRWADQLQQRIDDPAHRLSPSPWNEPIERVRIETLRKAAADVERRVRSDRQADAP